MRTFAGHLSALERWKKIEEELLNSLDIFGQHHIIKHYRALSLHQRESFLQANHTLDLPLVFELYRNFSERTLLRHSTDDITPPDVVCIPRDSVDHERSHRARQVGESLIGNSKVAVLIVAGGQGSRLGFDGPKGTYPLSPVKGKTLFQLFAEQVRSLSLRYSAIIPLLIMTSNDNHSDTVQFFRDNRYFGLDPDAVHFFSQGVLPAVSPEGRLIMRDVTHIYASPNGHGGSLKALSDSGLLAKLIAGGYEQLFYCQVDNPLVRIADPVFLGHHSMEGAEASTKVVRRRSIEEKVGVYLRVESRDAVMEYSDIDGSLMSALDDRGEILYWAGNTAIHIFSLSFIKRLTWKGFALPYHCAEKSAYVVSSDWEPANVNVWKFETFVFDAIPLADKACCMEVAREEEFAPVKNKDGPDSPETARLAMTGLYRSWLRRTGIDVPDTSVVEISPLLALDDDELAQKVRERHIIAAPQIYIE